MAGELHECGQLANPVDTDAIDSLGAAVFVVGHRFDQAKVGMARAFNQVATRADAASAAVVARRLA